MPIIEVPIPTSPCLGCPFCDAIAVNLDGQLVPCSDADCPYGGQLLQLDARERADVTKWHGELQAHVDGCSSCRAATSVPSMCAAGGEFWTRAHRWYMGTTVRKLTDAETAELRPLLQELQTHVESCAACASARSVSTAADLVASGLCEVGQRLYSRWLDWLTLT